MRGAAQKEKLIFKDQGIAIDYTMGIPIPNLSRFREKHITGNRFTSLIIYREHALSFCDKRDIIVSQRMDRT